MAADFGKIDQKTKYEKCNEPDKCYLLAFLKLFDAK